MRSEASLAPLLSHQARQAGRQAAISQPSSSSYLRFFLPLLPLSFPLLPLLLLLRLLLLLVLLCFDTAIFGVIGDARAESFGAAFDARINELEVELVNISI